MFRDNKILIIAPHADDEVIGCGGFIREYSQDNEINVMILTIPVAVRGIIERIENITKITGVTITMLNYEDQKFDTIPRSEVIDTLRTYIEKFNIDTVLMPYIHDANSDHKIVAECATVACRPFDSGVKNLIMYEVPESTMLSVVPFAPNYYVPFKWSDKAELLSCYTYAMKDLPFPRSHSTLQDISRMRGIECGNNYNAEAFQIVRITT